MWIRFLVTGFLPGSTLACISKRLKRLEARAVRDHSSRTTCAPVL